MEDGNSFTAAGGNTLLSELVMALQVWRLAQAWLVCSLFLLAATAPTGLAAAEGEAAELPVLPSWTSPDTACARQFVDEGGYGEMSVIGLSIECEEIDDGSGAEYIFHRVGYCRLECNSAPWLPGCDRCGNGASGSF